MTIPEIFAKHGEAVFPRRRKARDRAAARQRPAGAGDRRRRDHGPDDPRPHPHQGHLGLAEGRSRRADEAHQAAQRPPAGRTRSRICCRCANRSMRSPISSCSRATSRTTPSSTKSSPLCRKHLDIGRGEQAMTAPLRAGRTDQGRGRARRARLRYRHRPRPARESLGERIAALRPGAKVAIVTDATVAKHHLAAAEDALKAAGIESSRHRGAAGRGLEKFRRPSRLSARRSSPPASSAAISSSRSAAA